MKIYQKLTLSFLSTSFLLALLGGISLRINLKIEDDSQHVTNNSIIEVESAKEMLRSLQAIHASSQELLLEKYQEDITQETAALKKEILLANQIIKQELSDFQKNIIIARNATLNSIDKYLNIPYGENLTEKEELISLEEVEKEFYLYRKLINNYLYLTKINHKEAYKFLEEQLEPQVKDILLPLVKKYQDDALKELRFESQEIKDSAINDNLLISTFSLISFFIALVLGLLTSHYISRPIQRLTLSALKVGQGKLEPIEIGDLKGEDELVILAKTFNQMVEGLKQTTVSKSYLDDILGSMIDSLIAMGMDGNIHKVNQATLMLLGYQESELINQNIKIILPDSSMEIASLVPKSFMGSCETTYLTKEGKKIPVAFSSSFILDDQGGAKGIVCIARDITEKQITEKALRESEERYALASRAANDGLWDWNLKTSEIYFSPRWKSLLGYEEREISNIIQEWFKRVHPDYLDQLSQGIINYLQNSISQFEMIYPMRHKNGNYLWMLCRGIAIQDEEGRVYRITGSQTDVTQSQMAQEKLRYDALHDKLTDLPNRTFFMEQLQKSLQQSQERKDYKFAVLFLDVDRFKSINDSLGHLAGDELLIEIANRLKICLRNENTIARLGGDEFAILLEGIEDVKEASAIADRIQKQLALPFSLEGREVFVTASIGIALSTSQCDRLEDLLRNADTAMYRAKSSGKARHAIFEPGMHLEAVKILELENDLRRAIERAEFQVFYQPIVKLKDRKLVGFEALVRWLHPEKGLITPEKFIPLAEETGTITSIGWWVMRQACQQMRIWHKEYPMHPPITISVNVSAKQFEQANELSDRIERILEETGLQPSCLKIEITESAIVKNNENLTMVLQKLKSVGIRLSMDDFGTGYSSLSYIHSLPIDTIKIDRSFIRDIDIDREKFQLTQTIVNLANSLGMDAIAEGVETNKQLAKLTEINCEYGQGYLFSKPVSSEMAEFLIKVAPRYNASKLKVVSHQKNGIPFHATEL